MKIHVFITGFRNGIMNLDKKLPYLIKTYPNGKIKKTTNFNFPCIQGRNIINNSRFVKILGKKIDTQINIDFHGFSHMCLSYFDISFDVDASTAKALIQHKIFHKALFEDNTQVMIDEKLHSFGVLLTQNILPYYDMKTWTEIETSFHTDITSSSLNKNLAIMEEKTAMHPYCSIGIMTGMSVGPHDNCMIIEDYDNELDTNSESWENILIDDESIYLNKIKYILVCKNKKYYGDCSFYHMSCQVTPYMFKYARETTSMFLNTIKKQGDNIKQNIIDDNNNSYYWKELKKNIEVLDLNFLEFYTDMINMSRIDFDALFVNWPEGRISQKHQYERENYMIKIIENLHSDLNEIKYAISNLSTPSHTHDEAILQKETETVNDRILMLSFIAMAVSAIGMIQSDEISIALKIMSGSAIFSLPILYYMLRKFQKILSLRKNEHNELTRRLDLAMQGLEQARKERDTINNQKDLPEDFKIEALEFMEQFIVAEKKQVDILKKKMK